MQKRSPWQVTLHVWHALFMREAMARITGDRLGWLWIFVEPIAHILIFIGIRQLMGSIRHVNGALVYYWYGDISDVQHRNDAWPRCNKL